MSTVREKDYDIQVEFEKVIEEDFSDFVKKEALSLEDIAQRERQDCFVNYGKDEICEIS